MSFGSLGEPPHSKLIHGMQKIYMIRKVEGFDPRMYTCAAKNE
jgi:glutamate synthase domain-containing protein 2